MTVQVLTCRVLPQEQKKRELEEMNRVLAELGIETPAVESTTKTETKGAPPGSVNTAANCLGRLRLGSVISDRYQTH